MKTSTYHAWDRALDGKLGEILLALRAENLSPEDIAYQLRTEHDIKVSRSTIARWLDIAADESSEPSDDRAAS